MAVEAPPDQLGDYHLSDCPARRRATSARPARLGAAYQQPPAASRPRRRTSTTRPGRPWVASTPAPTSSASRRHRRRPPTPTCTSRPPGNTNPPGVAGTADDADVYRWNGTAFSRSSTSRARRTTCPPAPTSTASPGSTPRTSTPRSPTAPPCPGPGRRAGRGRRLLRRRAPWTMWFDGTRPRADPTRLRPRRDQRGRHHALLLDHRTRQVPPGPGGTGDNADIYRWNGAQHLHPGRGRQRGAVRAAEHRRRQPTNPNVDGLVYVDATHFYLSFSNDHHERAGPAGRRGAGRGRRLLRRRHLVGVLRRHRSRPDRGGARTSTRSRSAAAPRRPRRPRRRRRPADLLHGRQRQPAGRRRGPPTTPTSTAGTAPPTPRVFDATARRTACRPAPNVDGYARVDATHFYLSFTDDTTRPRARDGAGRGRRLLQRRRRGRCTSTARAHGLDRRRPGPRRDQRRRAATLYFSTAATPTRRGSAGTGDDADVYRWNGTVPGPGLRRLGRTACPAPPTSTGSTGHDATHSTCPSPTPTTPSRASARSRTRTSSRQRRHLVRLLRRHRPRPRHHRRPRRRRVRRPVTSHATSREGTR